MAPSKNTLLASGTQSSLRCIYPNSVLYFWVTEQQWASGECNSPVPIFSSVILETSL